MVRSELVDALAASNPGLTRPDVEAVVETFFDSIAIQLARGGRVELRGFGAFSTRPREARAARNPKTGASIRVAAKRAIHFKPGKTMREFVNS